MKQRCKILIRLHKSYVVRLLVQNEFNLPQHPCTDCRLDLDTTPGKREKNFNSLFNFFVKVKSRLIWNSYTILMFMN